MEADYKSGTLRTVDYALAQGRDVFAVPGSIISNNSRGTNRLIRDGAVMVLSAQDVWNEYSDQPMKKARRGAARAEFKGNKLTSLEQKILQLLATPKRIDELVNEKILNIDLPTLNAQLTMLEMRGYIKQLPGQYYHTVVKKISP